MSAAPNPPRTEVPTVCIAPMRRRHLRAVLRIEEQVNPSPWSHGLFAGELAQPSDRRAYLVARVGATIVGHAGVMLVADDGHVTTVAVDPAWQRRGVGKRLLLVLLREAMARGASNLTLEVRSTNRAARALYEHFGFAAEGVRRGYYSDSGEDAVIMWARDAGGGAFAEHLASIESSLSGPPLVDEVRSSPLRRRR